MLVSGCQRVSEHEVTANAVPILNSCLYIAPQKRMILLTRFWVSPSCCSHQSSSCICSESVFNAV